MISDRPELVLCQNRNRTENSPKPEQEVNHLYNNNTELNVNTNAVNAPSCFF